MRDCEMRTGMITHRADAAVTSVAQALVVAATPSREIRPVHLTVVSRTIAAVKCSTYLYYRLWVRRTSSWRLLTLLWVQIEIICQAVTSVRTPCEILAKAAFRRVSLKRLVAPSLLIKTIRAISINCKTTAWRINESQITHMKYISVRVTLMDLSVWWWVRIAMPLKRMNHNLS